MRVVYDRNAGHLRRDPLQQFEPFTRHRWFVAGEARDVAAWGHEALHEAGVDWIEILNKNDGYCVRLLPDRRGHGRRNDNYNVGLQCHELSCQGFHCVDRTAGPTLFDPNVAALRPSQCLQSLNERSTVEKPYGVTCNFRP